MGTERLPQRIGDAHIRLLRIYRVVVESGGFAAAEVELNISRPAISMAISELETLLDIHLCHRGRSGFSVTEAGERVYQAVLQLFASIESFRAQIGAIDTQLSGELNIGITDNLVTMPQMRITKALAELKRRGPQVVVNIRMIPPKDIEMAVLEGQLHTGVVPDLRRLPGLSYIPLYEEESRLYCSVDHPLFGIDHSTLSAQQLSQFDAVLPSYPQTSDVKEHQRILRPSATSTDREGMAFLILTGHYIGYLPTHFAKSWVEQGRLQAIQPDSRHLQIHYSAITRKGARQHLNTKVYIEELLNS